MSAERALCEHSAVVSSTHLSLTMKPCITTTKVHDSDVCAGNKCTRPRSATQINILFSRQLHQLPTFSFNRFISYFTFLPVQFKCSRLHGLAVHIKFLQKEEGKIKESMPLLSHDDEPRNEIADDCLTYFSASKNTLFFFMLNGPSESRGKCLLKYKSR